MSRRNALTFERGITASMAVWLPIAIALRAIERGQSHQPIALDPRPFRVAAD
jgi:hypothetical protein